MGCKLAALRKAPEGRRAHAARIAPEDLLFCTPKGTPLSPKNLQNRVLAPACDAIRIPRVSWHSFRHSNATLLGEVGESLKTAQAILGHSDLETTLNTCIHATPGCAAPRPPATNLFFTHEAFSGSRI